MVDRRNIGKRGERGHRVEMMLRVDDVGLDREVRQISGHRHDVALQQTFALLQAARIRYHRVAKALQIASNVSHESLRTTTCMEGSVGNEDSQSADGLKKRGR